MMSKTEAANQTAQLMQADLTPGELIAELRKICKRLSLDVRGLRTYFPDMGSRSSVEVWGCRYGFECQTFEVSDTDKRSMGTLAKCHYMARIIKAAAGA